MSLVFRDAFWQIFWRVISALAGFVVIKLLTPYLWPLRYGDYSTVLKYFAIWSALADFWIYVIALNYLWKIKDKSGKLRYYHKFLWFRFFMIFVVYLTAFLIAYLLPAYTSNPFIAYGLVIWMLFSATFMAAGIVQIPLQLNWQMKEVSFALILARIVQLTLLFLVVFVLFPKVDFNTFSYTALFAFLAVLFTVLASWVTQFLYVLVKWSKFMKFKLDFDFWFIKENLKKNWKYGVSYFLSSFHTLIVLIFLSVIFPTSKWFNYVWIWAVALALIEILLIVPSAFWNSIIHKISWYEKVDKQHSLGWYLIFIMWFGLLVLFNFVLFKTQIINLIAWKQYLTYPGHIWSDFILPFLSLVLFFSFIKQVFNYVLVSFDLQNKLFEVNLVWVTIWVIIWLLTIPKWNLYGWIITQLVLEICFVLWGIYIAYKAKILPKIDVRQLFMLFFFSLFWLVATYSIFLELWIYNFLNSSNLIFILVALVLNLVYLAISYRFIKKLMAKI